MPWDRDDYLAAALLITILILGILGILWITGNLPRSSDLGFPFGWLPINIQLRPPGDLQILP